MRCDWTRLDRDALDELGGGGLNVLPRQRASSGENTAVEIVCSDMLVGASDCWPHFSSLGTRPASKGPLPSPPQRERYLLASSLPPFSPTAIMPSAQEKKVAQADTRSVASGSDSSSADDNKLLEIGYVPSFKREFSNIATVRVQYPMNELLADFPADQLRVQYHGSVLEYRDHIQHALDSGRSRLRDLVLDPGGDDVLHARYVSSAPMLCSPPSDVVAPGAPERQNFHPGSASRRRSGHERWNAVRETFVCEDRITCSRSRAEKSAVPVRVLASPREEWDACIRLGMALQAKNPHDYRPEARTALSLLALHAS